MGETFCLLLMSRWQRPTRRAEGAGGARQSGPGGEPRLARRRGRAGVIESAVHVGTDSGSLTALNGRSTGIFSGVAQGNVRAIPQEACSWRVRRTRRAPQLPHRVPWRNAMVTRVVQMNSDSIRLNASHFSQRYSISATSNSETVRQTHRASPARRTHRRARRWVPWERTESRSR